jgi:hypothetical protein
MNRFLFPGNKNKKGFVLQSRLTAIMFPRWGEAGFSFPSFYCGWKGNSYFLKRRVMLTGGKPGWISFSYEVEFWMFKIVIGSAALMASCCYTNNNSKKVQNKGFYRVENKRRNWAGFLRTAVYPFGSYSSKRSFAAFVIAA